MTGVQTCALPIFRDLFSQPMLSGAWGEALQNPDMPYSAVYHIEIAMLFITLALIGPITRSLKSHVTHQQGFGVAQLPG